MRKKSDPTEALMQEATSINRKPRELPDPEKIERTTLSVKKEAIQLIEKALNPPINEKHKLVKKIAEASDVSSGAVYAAFRNFEKAVGGRARLIEILKMCPPNSMGFHMMMKLMADPDFFILAQADGAETEIVKYSLEAMCNRHKIPFYAIVTAFKDARLAEITIEALTAVGGKARGIIEQMADRAEDGYKECTTCQGGGRVKRISDLGEFIIDGDGNAATQMCWTCRGEGVVFKEHDWQNRNKFLELVGVSQKAPLVQQTIDNRQVNVGGVTPGEGGFESVMKALDAINRGKQPRRLVEAEVIDVQPESDSEESDGD